MPRRHNPSGIAPPASHYAHGVEHRLSGRRLVISGQVGLRSDGTLAEGLRAQLETAFDNLVAVLAAAGMAPENLVKVTGFVTVPGSVALWREVREAKLGLHAPAATYLEVAGLARPDWLAEIEGEAVQED
ncbi:MAG TPA: RidA family protein [Beijerinckiaceae bacterium]|jgi:enamine deaminase RidA (YjgF/YER057c/UK114 family)